MLTKDDLEAAAEAVAYEAKMLCFTASALPGGLAERFGDEPTFERNAFLESFLLHARVLDEFLSSTGRRASDVVAAHYIPGEYPIPTAFIGNERSAIDRQLAHLTTMRRMGKNFRVQRIALTLAAGYLDFARQLFARDDGTYWVIAEAAADVREWLDAMAQHRAARSDGVAIEDVYTGS